MLCDKCKKEINRTERQNSALHLLFRQLADLLNEKGFDMRAIIHPNVEIQWTPMSVKEYLWRPLQKALLQKHSTTELKKTGEIEIVWDTLNKILIERTRGEISLPPFPSYEIL